MEPVAANENFRERERGGQQTNRKSDVRTLFRLQVSSVQDTWCLLVYTGIHRHTLDGWRELLSSSIHSCGVTLGSGGKAGVCGHAAVA